jgi:hypothetical protein
MLTYAKSNSQMIFLIKVLVKITIGILLGLCFMNMPYEYYQILRYLVMLGFLFLAYDEKEENKGWMLFWLISALFINPIIKINLEKSEWLLCDFIWIIILTVQIIKNLKRSKQCNLNFPQFPKYYFEDYTYLNNDKIKIKRKGRSGILDSKSLQPIIPFENQRIVIFRDGLAIKKQNKWGIIDNYYKVVIPQIYEDFAYENDFSVSTSLKVFPKFGFNNDTLTNGIFTRINLRDSQNNTSNESIIRAKKNGKWGVLNENGKEITSCIFDGCLIIESNNRLSFIKGVKITIWNKTDIFINHHISLLAPLWNLFRKSIALVFSKIEYQYYPVIQTDGINNLNCYNEIIWCGFETIVRKKDKWGLLGINGREVLPCEYDIIGEQRNSLYFKKGGKWGLMNGKGEEIIPNSYGKTDYYDFVKGELIWVKQNKKYGFFEYGTGKEIAPCIYDRIAIYNGIANVEKDGIKYIIQPNGEILKKQ